MLQGRVLLSLLAVVVVGALIWATVLLVHRLTRTDRAPQSRASDALSTLEARGGRHRIGVQVVEAAAMAALFWIPSAALLLVPEARSGLARWALVATMTGAVLGAVWAWRRGVLRPIREERSNS